MRSLITKTSIPTPSRSDTLLTAFTGTRPLHTEKEGIDVLCLILAAYEGARNRTIAPVFGHSSAADQATDAS